MIVVEVHLAIDEVKRRVWPQYTATLHGRYGCPVELVVVTPSATVALWARQSIAIGSTHAMTPHVIGPAELPLMGARQVGESPLLGMLSTLAHLGDPACAQQAVWALEALAAWDQDADGRLADILVTALTVAVRDRMEELMRTGKYEYQSDFARKYFAKGVEEGREEGRTAARAEALLVVLRSRGIEVDDAALRRIEAERDETRLDAWLRRASTASELDEVLGDE